MLDLGNSPIANNLVDPDGQQTDPEYPLAIGHCESCSLVQLLDPQPADVIFNDEYPYYSSFSPALIEHAREHAESLVHSRELGSEALVVEVGSNDGYLLRSFLDSGAQVLGIDPSPGPAATAVENGVPTIVEFLGEDVAADVRIDFGAADVVIANNVMAHVPDLNDFVSGLATLVADDGVVTIQNPWVVDLIERVEFDTIYHEHYSYFSCTAVSTLLERHGLYLQHADYFPDFHGGTMRWHAGRVQKRSADVVRFLAMEAERNLHSQEFYEDFVERANLVMTELPRLLESLRDAGETVVAYGAAAKGATLLNASGVTSELLSYVVDRNVHKHGKAMPGCRLPICDPARLLDDQPDAVLLLAWNFAAEIVQQQSSYLAGGGRFLVPVGPGGVPGRFDPKS